MADAVTARLGLDLEPVKHQMELLFSRLPHMDAQIHPHLVRVFGRLMPNLWTTFNPGLLPTTFNEVAASHTTGQDRDELTAIFADSLLGPCHGVHLVHETQEPCRYILLPAFFDPDPPPEPLIPAPQPHPDPRFRDGRAMLDAFGTIASWLELLVEGEMQPETHPVELWMHFLDSDCQPMRTSRLLIMLNRDIDLAITLCQRGSPGVIDDLERSLASISRMIRIIDGYLGWREQSNTGGRLSILRYARSQYRVYLSSALANLEVDRNRFSLPALSTPNEPTLRPSLRDADKCAICLDCITSMPQCVTTCCGHPFHGKCLLQYLFSLIKGRAFFRCCWCRAGLSFEFLLELLDQQVWLNRNL
jgi:hypothetical protein